MGARGWIIYESGRLQRPAAAKAGLFWRIMARLKPYPFKSSGLSRGEIVPLPELAQGLKPFILNAYAALKRRSSTEPHAIEPLTNIP
jgi:hypothetical protein